MTSENKVKSESSLYRYEIWEDPNREGQNRFYIKFSEKNPDFLSMVFGPKTMTLRTYDMGSLHITYYETLEDAVAEVQKQVKEDEPLVHVKRWP
jgi:hypothetical protein